MTIGLMFVRLFVCLFVCLCVCYLFMKVFKFESEAEAAKTTSPMKPILQPFLEEQDKFAFNIPRKRFLVALQAYYEFKGCPLLVSERDEIIRCFTNPGTGDMNIRRVESYVRMHDKPCRKHGRMICGACSYFRECSFDDCECTLYKYVDRHK